MNTNHVHVQKLVLAALCLALCMVLPFLTGQIPEIGSALSPMHIPVLLAGFLCGPWWALAVGAVAPVLRFALFGMPPIFPTGLAMCFELATYGLISGLLSLATKALEALVGLGDLLRQMGEALIGFFGGFTDFLGAVFPFLPEETFTILNLGLILMIAAAVFKKFF